MISKTALLCLTSLVSSPTLAFLSPLKARTSLAQSKSFLPWTHEAVLVDSIQDVNNKDDEGGAKEQFDWFKAWHAVTAVDALDIEKPHKYHLLGMELVVWYDAPVEGGSFASKKDRRKGAKRRTKDGQWRVFLDECPHRKVPLSEGRVEDDGSLLCSYHAWRFNGTGNLIAAPQLDAEAFDRLACNTKSRCNSFPVQVVEGILWVWPETGDDAFLESALADPPAVYHAPDEELAIQEGRIKKGAWNHRLLPYGADYFLENVMDPAHVAVSHHNTVGNRYDDQRIEILPKSKLSKSGYSFFAKRPETMQYPPSGKTTFTAPGTTTLEMTTENGAMLVIDLYCSPAKPGFCNHVGRTTIVRPDKQTRSPPQAAIFALPLPIWLKHLIDNSFINQDALFLHHQERYMAKTGLYDANKLNKPDHYTKSVLPINSDLAVISFRNWLRVLAGGRIPYKHATPMLGQADSEVVFDMWNSHTKNCKHCLKALANFKRLRAVSIASAIGLAVWRPAKVWSTAAVLGLAAFSLGIHKLIGLFYKLEYSHAHND